MNIYLDIDGVLLTNNLQLQNITTVIFDKGLDSRLITLSTVSS